MNGSHLSLSEAKAKLDVSVLWQILALPGKPKKSCRCPFHADTKASFSVYTGKGGDLRFKCYAGCGEGGPVEFLALALDITARGACRRLLEMAGGNMIDALPLPRPKPIPPPSDHRPTLPRSLHLGSRDELRAVAKLRGISLEGVELASKRGLLWFASWHGHRAWIVTDQTRVNAQARRVDGGTWDHLEGVKAQTLFGSRAPWPIGTHEAAGTSYVIMVEGGPDILAAHHFIVCEGRESDTAVIGILGGKNRLPLDALEILAGKRVRIIPHLDEVGLGAVRCWTTQLREVGCIVDAFDLSGLPRTDGASIDDLNDLALLDADAYEADRVQLERILP